MSLARDITIAGVITTISIIVHYISVTLFSPGTPLWDVATDGTATLNGTARAGLWFQMLAVWIPLIAMAGIWLWVFVKLYRRQAVTGLGTPRRRP